MAAPTKIRGNRGTFRRHFLKEWLDDKEMDAMDLLNALNEAASMEQPVIDKSQVYRWLKGQLPHRHTQIRIAAALDLHDPETGEPDPEKIMTHPAQVWIARKVSGLDKEDIKRLKAIVENAFPGRTGTEG